MGGRLSLDGGVERQHHLLQTRRRSLDEAADGEVFGPYALNGGKRAAEHVILSAPGPGAFQGPEISDLLDHADGRAVPARIAAQRARIAGIDIAADAAHDGLVTRIDDRRGERRQELVAVLD